MINPIKISSLPAPLTFFNGGLYVGLFNPGPPITTKGSTVLGNENTGKAMEYDVVPSENGLKNYIWGLVISPEDILDVILRKEEEKSNLIPVSTYDGAYNSLFMTLSGTKKVDEYDKGGYKDWYIPSRDELAFIAKNLPKNFNLDSRFFAMSDITYLSSTYSSQNYPTKTEGKFVSLLFAQSFNEYTYGDTSLVSDGKSMPVRMVRKVPVYIN